MRARAWLAALVFSILASAAAAAQSSLVIVAHPSVGPRSISQAELSKIFLKKLRTWEDGQRALPVDQVPGPIREAFSETVHGRSMITIEVYWKRMIYSGRDVPPAEAAGDEAVLEFVRSTPGAVGYVSPNADLEGVITLSLE